MSLTPSKAQTTTAKPPKKSGKGKLILIAAPVLLILAGAGLWFSGVLPRLLGIDHTAKQAAETPNPVEPRYVDIPEMIDNLSDPFRPHYVKLDARVVVPKPDDVPQVVAAMPRLQDLLTIYLRDMRIEELHNTADTDRLRAELVVRANAAVAPAKISNILFTQLLAQ
ncbi:MAG TPA: flagellar basal body-associated FliL family protein [Rhodopila sp.]|jgi:flagellar FliL protein